MLKGNPHRITESDRTQALSEWATVGDVLTFVESDDIWVVDADGSTEPTRFVGGPAEEAWPAFSPGGKWLAYASDQDGDWEIYVRPYLQGEPVYGVTRREGGSRPVRFRDGRERLCLIERLEEL